MSEEIATAAADLETVRQLRAALDVAMQENDGLHAALATAVQREREAGADMVAIVNAAAAYLAAMTWSPASDPKWKPGDGIIDYRTPEQRLQKLLKGPGRPGAALLAELEAARAALTQTAAAMRDYRYCIVCDRLLITMQGEQNDPHTPDCPLAAYDEALKANGEQ